MKHLNTFLLLAGLLAVRPLMAQKSAQRPLNVGAPFLMVNPDARSSATGGAVTGLEPDANAIYANAAKLPFAGDWGASVSYSPWMWDLLDKKTHMAYISGFKTWGGQQSVGAAVRYFNYGDVTFRDDNGTVLQQYKPREYSVDLAYGRKLGNLFALAVTARYIRSELGNGTYNGQLQKPASAVAGDISLYSQGYADHIDGNNRYAWGISFTNIGSKLSYTDATDTRTFLPMNLRIGGGYTFVRTEDHKFTIAADVNKLLVPTPPTYKLDPDGMPTNEIEKGKDPDRSVVESIFSSFGDAPGGFREEFSEFSFAGGIEYAYQSNFFVRTGYFYEDPAKGNRQQFSTGFGVRVQGFQLDFAYLIPTGGSLRQRKSMNFTLMYTPFRDNR
ncbi:type IX secretion system outer membrane channel protein PorV [uncultured Chitinophaga sp.]|uniref:type IX secretion system outer membrane channel protein PorV n=1 Tax=uncultured Chitinophaga sp. TaxID=339340 RepID=UPI00261ECE28|nr:type IX secretion system outer membrane channel protein PorV [uncultured Chitinophaga sp.]